ncbi:MAG: hypothetical protein M1445_05795 [Bacteroidetes bacterium]|nr:hypothetical protein [Bacteroidota bacterium]MCL6103595.1 hypothetical protein [Bacteroidota bacterium]
MASFADHISQSRKNLSFLQDISNLSVQYWDWDVTVCYYVAVHLVNSHIASVSDLHYRKHEEVSNALNPYINLSLTKVTETVYLAYTQLQNLSRRSRYLISENMGNRSADANITYDKHFKRALVHLETLLTFVESTYGQEFEKISVRCNEARSIPFNHFVVI